MNKIHFCGGLPRSGSTVLMNILQQNPQIFTTGTCALYEILQEKILIKGRYSESFQAMNSAQADRAMHGLIHGATRGWFEALTHKPTVISKRHGWSSLFHLFPNSKYICMVRDPCDIAESFQRVNNKTLALHSFGDQHVMTPAMHQHELYNHYFSEANSLSASLNKEVPRLMEVFRRTPNRVLFVRYEDLTKDPIYMLNKIYTFLGEIPFEHDLHNIYQSHLFEHDHAYFRERTDHHVIREFRFWNHPVRDLPASFHQRIVNEHKWFYEGFYPEVLSNE
jgi:sulfotransferase